MNKEMREKTHERCTCDEKVVERMEGGGGGGEGRERRKERERKETLLIEMHYLQGRDSF